MATLKHISSKNSDYTAIEAYLVYQHDAFTGKQLLDEQGKPKLRDSYLLDTLECGDFSFATACLLAVHPLHHILKHIVCSCLLRRVAFLLKLSFIRADIVQIIFGILFTRIFMYLHRTPGRKDA